MIHWILPEIRRRPKGDMSTSFSLPASLTHKSGFPPPRKYITEGDLSLTGKQIKTHLIQSSMDLPEVHNKATSARGPNDVV